MLYVLRKDSFFYKKIIINIKNKNIGRHNFYVKN